MEARHVLGRPDPSDHGRRPPHVLGPGQRLVGGRPAKQPPGLGLQGRLVLEPHHVGALGEPDLSMQHGPQVVGVDPDDDVPDGRVGDPAGDAQPATDRRRQIVGQLLGLGQAAAAGQDADERGGQQGAQRPEAWTPAGIGHGVDGQLTQAGGAGPDEPSVHSSVCGHGRLLGLAGRSSEVQARRAGPLKADEVAGSRSTKRGPASSPRGRRPRAPPSWAGVLSIATAGVDPGRSATVREPRRYARADAATQAVTNHPCGGATAAWGGA